MVTEESYETFAAHRTPPNITITLRRVLFIVVQGGMSVLSRLVGAVQAWAGGSGAAVQVLSLQPLEGRTPATRVWLSAVGIANFDYLMLYHKDEASVIY